MGLWNRDPLQTLWDVDDDDFQQPKRRLKTLGVRKRRTLETVKLQPKRRKNNLPVAVAGKTGTQGQKASLSLEEPLRETGELAHQSGSPATPGRVSETQSSETTRAVRAIQSYLLEEQEEIESGPGVRHFVVEVATTPRTPPTQEHTGSYQSEAPESNQLEAGHPPQTQQQSVEPEDLVTGPDVGSVHESFSADVFFTALNAIECEIGNGPDLNFGDLLCESSQVQSQRTSVILPISPSCVREDIPLPDLNLRDILHDSSVSQVQSQTLSDILPTLPTCLREDFPLSESFSELPSGSAFFRYCENSHLAADSDCLDQQIASTPVQEGAGVNVSEGERFFPNLGEVLLSDFIGSVNDRGDRLENSLNFKISELAKFDKDLEKKLVREIVETQRQNRFLLNLVRAHCKSFTLYKSLQSYRSLTTRRDIIELNKKQDVIIDLLTRLVNILTKKD